MFPGQAGLNVAVSLEKNAGYYLGDSSKCFLTLYFIPRNSYRKNTFRTLNKFD